MSNSSPPHAASLGVEPEVAPFYAIISKSTDNTEAMRKAARDIYHGLKELAVIDWPRNEDVKREMRRKIKRTLNAGGYPQDKIPDTTTEIMDLASRRLKV